MLGFSQTENFFLISYNPNFISKYSETLAPIMIKILPYSRLYSHCPLNTLFLSALLSSLKPDMSKDYYSILQVSQSSNRKEIKMSYYNLVKKHHPDQNKAESDNKIKQLNEAYSVLSDQSAKKQYDDKRKQNNPSPKKPASASDYAQKTSRNQKTYRRYPDNINTEEQFDAWYNQRVKNQQKAYKQQRYKWEKQFYQNKNFEDQQKEENFQRFYDKTWNKPDQKIKLTEEQLQRQRIKIRMKLADAYVSLQQKKKAYKIQNSQNKRSKAYQIFQSIEQFLKSILKPVIDFIIMVLNKGRSKLKIGKWGKPKKNL